nr:LCP family protein [uncultured Blautia sp.]
MVRYRKKSETKKIYKKLFLAVVILTAGIGMIAWILGAADRRPLQQAIQKKEKSEIVFQGETYIPKGNLETYLFAGIDDLGKITEIREYDGSGQCDVLVVLVRDRSTDQCQMVTIDRNTITPVKSLEDDGNYISTDDMQISLAHAMSLDHVTRAENTVDAVSTLLGGAKIDYYAMVNVGAVQPANDLVGGVTVTVKDDFSGVDDSLKKGETVTLMGVHAENFIRGRMTMKDDDTNQNRMARQAQYEEGFRSAFRQKCSEDSSFPLKMYHTLEDYMTTTVTARKFSRLALLLTDETKVTKLDINGTYGVDDSDWQTFTPDTDSLKQVILTLFYKKQN